MSMINHLKKVHMDRITQLLKKLEDNDRSGDIIACKIEMFSDGSGSLIVETTKVFLEFDFESIAELYRKIDFHTV